MTLFSQVRGLPVAAPGGGGHLGVVRSLTVDAASERVVHAHLARGRLRRDALLVWADLHPTEAGLTATRPPTVPSAPSRELAGAEVLTECGEEHGTVVDASFDPLTGRLETVLTTRGEIPADRLLGLGGHALVVRDPGGHHRD